MGGGGGTSTPALSAAKNSLKLTLPAHQHVLGSEESRMGTRRAPRGVPL